MFGNGPENEVLRNDMEDIAIAFRDIYIYIYKVKPLV